LYRICRFVGNKNKQKIKRGGAKGMSRTFVIQNDWLRSGVAQNRKKVSPKASFGKSFFASGNAKGKETVSGRTKLSLVSLCSALLIVTFLSGVFYLYQANFIATQSFDMREIENKIQESERESKQLKIKEIELRSMYNIEKATENLDLVNSSNITYLEIAGPMAMR
jgi:hypothetical protein